MANPFKPVILRPLLGILDNRSSPDMIPPGAFSHKLNMAVNPDSQLCRALGFKRFYDSVCPANHDLHLQGISLADREPVTTFFASVSNEGVRTLFAATKSRIRKMNESAGTWPIIGDGFGLDGEDSLTQLRFRIAELQNRVVFTNGFDIPHIHTLGSSTVAPIGNLALVENELTPNVAGLTKAKVVISWNGFMFLMNVTEGGVRLPSRVRWSHLNDATFWQPGETAPDTTTSIADYQDLPYSEKILAAIPLQGSLFVLTDSSIWRCNLTISTDPGNPFASLSCQRVYSEPKNKAKCIAFPNTLTSDGVALWYLGADGVYRFTPGQDVAPERVEWIHRATGVIFKDAATRIDKTACESPIIEFRPGTNPDDTAGLGELWVSWPRYDADAEAVPDDSVDCETYVAAPPIPGTGLNRFCLVINTKHSTADFRNFGLTALTSYRADAGEQGDCNQNVTLVGANSEDYCLKQMDTGTLREMYDPISGLYSEVGYDSVLRGVFPFDRPDAEKKIASFLAEIVAANPSDLAVVRLRLGTSDRVVDINGNNGNCGVLWHQLSDKPMRCSYTKTPAQYVAANVRPNPPNIAWDYLLRGRFLMYELTLTSADHSPLKTGACILTRLEVEAALV